MTATLIVHNSDGPTTHKYDCLKTLGENLVEIFKESKNPKMVTMISMDREGGELTVRIQL